MPRNPNVAIVADTFAARLGAAMEAHGMTQRALAAAAGLSESAVSQYLSGAREPNLRVLANLCSALETTPSALVPVTTDACSASLHDAASLVAANAAQLASDDRRSLVLALLDS